jgi:hypothetical protein
MYAYCVYTNGPLAYWRFEETNDTFNSSMQAYDYSGHNYDATYLTSGTPGTGALDGGETLSNIGLNGPTPIINGHAIYSGFPANNGCASLTKDSANGYLTVPPLNINTNTVTFTMWLYANSGVVYANSGLLMWRNGHDGAGVGFCGTIYSNVIQGISMPYLGYTWNNNGSATYSWSSGLALPSSTWSFAAWVLTPTNTTVYLYYVSGGKTNLSKSVLNIANNPESFSGGQTFLGADPQVPGGGRTFDGSIDEVAVFTNSMTESQIQDLFLKSIGLLSGVPPTITVPPASTTCFQGQTLQLSAAATGIPSPSYQWQFELGTTTSWASMSQSTATGIGAPTNSVVNWYNYSGAYTNFRVIAINPYGKATSSVPIAVVTMIPLTNFNKGLWTVNFDVITANNSGPDVPYVGPGVLGTNYLGTNGLGATIPIYWNALSGSTFASTPPTLLMDGVTKTTVNLGATNYGNGSFFGAGAFGGFPTTNLLRDQFMSFPTNGTAMVFTGVPTGVYNLAVYASVGGYTNRGVVLTVGGVTQSLTNAQDQQFLPDNTAFFPNLLVTSGSLEVDMKPLASTLLYPTNTEGDFNGAQLELIKAGPGISSLTNNGGNFVLSWVGGGLYSSTNVMPGPWWGTNPAVSPYTFAPTGATRFFKIFNPTFPN